MALMHPCSKWRGQSFSTFACWEIQHIPRLTPVRRFLVTAPTSMRDASTATASVLPTFIQPMLTFSFFPCPRLSTTTFPGVMRGVYLSLSGAATRSPLFHFRKTLFRLLKSFPSRAEADTRGDGRAVAEFNGAVVRDVAAFLQVRYA